MTNDDKSKIDQRKTHGLYSFRDQGEKTLTDPRKIERLSELRELVSTNPGRIDLKRELAARFALLVELAFFSLQERYGNPDLPKIARLKMWEDPVIKQLGKYANTFMRALDSFPPDEGDPHDLEIVRIRERIDLPAEEVSDDVAT